MPGPYRLVSNFEAEKFPMRIVIGRASGSAQVPNSDVLAEELRIEFAPDAENSSQKIAGAEILLGWNFWGNELKGCWAHAD